MSILSRPPLNDAGSVADITSISRRVDFLKSIETVCVSKLRPLVRRIDEDGEYPLAVMREFGQCGLYGQHLSRSGLGQAIDMPLAIEAMAMVGFECLSTAFCVWCHDACGWYLENTSNQHLKDALLPQIASGDFLGATGLSNPMKFYSGIESLRVQGTKVDGGYVLNGTLPWVSNLGEDHLFGVVFECADDASQRVMAMAFCNQPGVLLCDGGRFIALEGSATYAVRFVDCFVSQDMILADPADAYIQTIRPGFVLMQVGMGIGLVRACVQLMRKHDKTHAHVNRHLPLQPDEIETAAQELLDRTCELAKTPRETDRGFVIAALQARLDAGELSLSAAQACMLSGGAKAYMDGSNQFRKLREAYFVGVVTPATKHLRKEIARLKAA